MVKSIGQRNMKGRFQRGEVKTKDAMKLPLCTPESSPRTSEALSGGPCPGQLSLLLLLLLQVCLAAAGFICAAGLVVVCVWLVLFVWLCVSLFACLVVAAGACTAYLWSRCVAEGMKGTKQAGRTAKDIQVGRQVTR